MLKKIRVPSVAVYQGDELLYRGTVEDLPMEHSVVIQKSIQFFDDANPCYIHETAVRVRLIAEIEERIQQGKGVLELIKDYSVYHHADKVDIP